MSFQQGLSGLNASSKNLEVIGNNIANANTYGAKTSRAEFSHLYTNSLGDVTQNAGIGVRVDAVAQQFTQGGITDTNIPTDLAITGSGFFQVSDGVNPTLYTRNGQFKVNSQGEIVNNDGLHLMGYPADIKGVIQPGVAQPLRLSTAGMAPQTTSKIAMELNVDSRATATNPVTVAQAKLDTANAAKTTADAAKTTADAAKTAADTAKFNADTNLLGDPTNPALIAAAAAAATAATNAATAAANAATAATNAANNVIAATANMATATAGPAINFSDPTTYNNATSQTVYDAKGQAVTLTYYFQKVDSDTWNVFASANGTSLATAGGAPDKIAQLKFSPNGQSMTSTPDFTQASNTLTIPATTMASGATTLPIAGVAFDVAKITQVGRSFSVTNLTQDGAAAGALANLNIQSDGTVMAVYSNGKSVAAGQIELANFRNPQGLQPLAGNVWASTLDAGEAIKGTPNNGVLGKLQSGALEESNVDIAAELVNMITAQRAYQANAQTIKTQDQVMQTLVNLK